jgi:crotonyl-CoA carboxylase/reductase
MAAGINFNNVWAARGLPIDVIRVRQKAGEPWDFHIGGSDASGVVYAVGDAVSDVAVGDEVVIHHGWWDAVDPWVAAGKDLPRQALPLRGDPRRPRRDGTGRRRVR